jgi:hypothetical protein
MAAALTIVCINDIVGKSVLGVGQPTVCACEARRGVHVKVMAGSKFAAFRENPHAQGAVRLDAEIRVAPDAG